jgi:methyl-accepting chemotaxis protein
MNQFFMQRTHAVSVPQTVAKSLAVLRQEIEQVFWESGDNLEKAVSNLNDLNGQFRKLDTALGHDAETALLEMIGVINDHFSKLQTDCATFNALSATLRKSISVIGAQVRELDSVVRTIANISVNARIQGNSLMPPRPQVSAFIERLAAMSSESEGILREINDAMASVVFDVAAMEEEQRELLRELTTTVFPAIAGFTGLARQMRAGQTGIKEATVTLAKQADGIRRDVSMLIVALQIGDSTRQRIERIEDTLQRSSALDGAARRVLYALAAALDDGSSQSAS